MFIQNIFWSSEYLSYTFEMCMEDVFWIFMQMLHTFVILTKTEMFEQMFVKFLCKSIQCFLTCNMHLAA
jgi:hypothetical protein